MVNTIYKSVELENLYHFKLLTLGQDVSNIEGEC